MPGPACVPCGRAMRCDKNDVTVIIDGCQAWSGDRWKCLGCGALVVSGWGRGPLAEDFQGSFQHYDATADHRIKDHA